MIAMESSPSIQAIWAKANALIDIHGREKLGGCYAVVAGTPTYGLVEVARTRDGTRLAFLSPYDSTVHIEFDASSRNITYACQGWDLGKVAEVLKEINVDLPVMNLVYSAEESEWLAQHLRQT